MHDPIEDGLPLLGLGLNRVGGEGGESEEGPCEKSAVLVRHSVTLGSVLWLGTLAGALAGGARWWLLL
jgi:hypothetical protein